MVIGALFTLSWLGFCKKSWRDDEEISDNEDRKRRVINSIKHKMGRIAKIV